MRTIQGKPNVQTYSQVLTVAYRDARHEEIRCTRLFEVFVTQRPHVTFLILFARLLESVASIGSP